MIFNRVVNLLSEVFRVNSSIVLRNMNIIIIHVMSCMAYILYIIRYGEILENISNTKFL